jgi:hypothetical protein
LHRILHHEDERKKRNEGSVNVLHPKPKQQGELLRGIIHEMTPSHGPWFEVINILKLCNEAFNKSASSIARKGMPTNQIPFVAHILHDKRFVACIIPLTVTVERELGLQSWIK